MKKMFLTSLFATMVAMPAFADNNSYTNNQTYENSCTVDVLGESSGTAPATAHWSTNQYFMSSGYYLPAGNSWTSDDQYTPCLPGQIQGSAGCPRTGAVCPAGSYCDGGYSLYNATTDRGINACPSGFPLSDTRSDNPGQCYRVCTTNDVAHSTAVKGRVYTTEWGDAANLCGPANSNSCVSGYHYTGILDLDLSPSINGTTLADTGISVLWDDIIMSAITTAPNWSVTWGNITLNGVSLYDRYEPDPYGDVPVEDFDSGASGPSGDGCYCRLTSWTGPNSTGGNLNSTHWIFRDYDTDPLECTRWCVKSFMSDAYFRSRVLKTTPGLIPECEANTITVNWGDGDDNPNNNPTTQCVYDGDLVTPTTAPTKRGYTFTGWTFSSQN